MKNDLICSECGASDIRKVSVVFASQSEARRTDEIAAAPHWDWLVAPGKPTYKSHFAQSIAPPTIPSLATYMGRAVVFGGLAGLIIGSLLVAILTTLIFPSLLFLKSYLLIAIIIISIWLAIGKLQKTYEAAKLEYDKKNAEWNSSWVCIKCGTLIGRSIQPHYEATA